MEPKLAEVLRKTRERVAKEKDEVDYSERWWQRLHELEGNLARMEYLAEARPRERRASGHPPSR